MAEEVKVTEGQEKDMVNTVMKVPIEKSKANSIPLKTQYSIEDYAITFVYGMGKTQRERFKKMLEQGITCGESVAYNYGIEYKPFIVEVKRILKVEE